MSGTGKLFSPGCDLCDNEPCFPRGSHVAIPPLPPIAVIKRCQSSNHHKCFAKSMESSELFAHSVEQLVVWIVESEKGWEYALVTPRASIYYVRRILYKDPLPLWCNGRQ